MNCEHNYQLLSSDKKTIEDGFHRYLSVTKYKFFYSKCLDMQNKEIREEIDA